MLKPTNKFFAYSQIGLDILAIVLAYFGSFWIRYLLNPLFSRQFSPRIMPTLVPPIYLCVLILLIVLNYFGIYELRKKKNLLDIFLSVFQCISLGTAVLLSITFLFKAEGYSRSLIVIFWGTSILSLTVSHVLGVRLLSWSKLKDFGLERIAIVGINKTTAKIAERIKKYDKNYRFEGYIQDERTDETQLTPEIKHQLIGKLDDLAGVINRFLINRILVSDISLTPKELSSLMHVCEKMDVHLDRIPGLLSITSKKVTISEIDGILLIGIRKIRFTRTDQVIKRIFDLAVAAAIVVLLLPFLLLIGLLIKLDSKGPIFFKQRRVGKGGKYFIFYKFRSMTADAEAQRPELDGLSMADGCLFKIVNDPRITRVGKLLRKFSLDELAQFINVFRGEMSLVGPRPLPSSDIEKGSDSPDYQFWAEKRTEVLPGLTGLWQISGRSDLSFEDMVELDMSYLENWSLWLDIKTLIRTVPVVLLGKGSY